MNCQRNVNSILQLPYLSTIILNHPIYFDRSTCQVGTLGDRNQTVCPTFKNEIIASPYAKTT
jgi:hypothetical protein